MLQQEKKFISVWDAFSESSLSTASSRLQQKRSNDFTALSLLPQVTGSQTIYTFYD